MEKQNVSVEIFRLQSDSPLKWKDIKHIDFQEDDEIAAYHDEGHYSENNSWDPHYMTVIERKVLETDEQFEKRIAKAEKKKQELKVQRYDHFLKLKAEFEPSTEQTETKN